MARPRGRIRREHIDSLLASSPHGKDAKLAALVREADNIAGPKAADARFEPKKIGKRAIFRPILTSPFNARWPDITPVVQDVILHSLLYILQSEDTQKNFKRNNLITPQASSRKTKEKNKRRKARFAVEVLKQQGIASDVTTELSMRKPPSTAPKQENIAKEKPILCGLNSVTRQMESLTRNDQLESSSSPIKHSPSVIFVCQSDIDPPSLVSHFPLLCSTYNAVCKQNSYLIKLPLDSEKQLCDATSLRRCSVLSIDKAQLKPGSEGQTRFKELIVKLKETNVEAMRMEWLDKAIASLQEGQKQEKEDSSMHLLEPRVKHMKSSAPLNINLVKANTREKRAAKKATRKLKSQAKIDSRLDHLPRSVKGKNK